VQNPGFIGSFGAFCAILAQINPTFFPSTTYAQNHPVSNGSNQA
jgi:hypothetical protein